MQHSVMNIHGLECYYLKSIIKFKLYYMYGLCGRNITCELAIHALQLTRTLHTPNKTHSINNYFLGYLFIVLETRSVFNFNKFIVIVTSIKSIRNASNTK